MTKELENLETLKDMLIGNSCNNSINDYVDNLILPIKQALQRLEQIDNSNPSKALEELGQVIEEITIGNTDLRNTLKQSVLIAIIKQALLKAQENEKVLNEALKLNGKWAEELDDKNEILNIILEKNVDITLLKRSENWLDYYTRVKHKTGKNTELTQEEFDLLKRYVKNDIN